jgi:molybdopterin/thiamine biosynthesis adenylyltransferase
VQEFDYHNSFSRNIGWLSTADQDLLRTKRVAIAGLGGVGGSHLLTLTRLGITNFHVSDLDVFEEANFNRQAGAFRSTIGMEKVDVLTNLALDINPKLEVKRFPSGVTEENLGEFLHDVDVYVDGLDFFAVKTRQMVFAACAEKKIPAVTAAPIGMGAAVINFMPGGMTFEEYFRLEGRSEQEQLIRFLLGLCPALLHRNYMINPEALDFAQRKGPSTAMACEICAGMAATQIFKILTNRGKVLAAPWGQQFDSYRNKYVKTWRPGGNNNPIQRVVTAIAKSVINKKYGTKNRPV